MKHYFKIFTICIGLLAVLCSCSDDDHSPVPPAPVPAGEGYCLMFYVSGGDSEHDLSFMTSVTQAAQATTGRSDVAVTCLFKASGNTEGDAHNGICRYTGEDGALVKDDGFSPDTDFNITNPSHLTDYIRWSAEQFPRRNYLLVFAGHGRSFTPEFDLPDTRATIKDGSNCMTSTQLAQGIRDAGIHLAAMIAHSCEQGSVEMLAEWEGLADYLLGSPFSVPDMCHDYYSLLTDLSEGRTLEEALSRTANRSMNLWKESHDNGRYGTVVEVTRLNDLTTLWNVLRETFSHMKSNLDGVNCTTDPPSILGETYREGYRRALQALYMHDKDDFFEAFRAEYAIDLPDFLRNAYVYSGNISLAPYVNRVDEVIGDVLVTHLQSNGQHDFVYNVYVGNALSDGKLLDHYRTCRFDRLTGWSDLCAALFETSGKWLAETIVDEAEIELSGGLDGWFKSEDISDEVFSRMWLKPWKEDCPLNRSNLRYLKMLHRNAEGGSQRGEMVVNAAIADKVLTIFRQLYSAGYRYRTGYRRGICFQSR